MSILEPPEPARLTSLRRPRRRALRLVRSDSDASRPDAPRPDAAGSVDPAGLRPAARRGCAAGPVADLEAHVRPDWWHEIFDALYLKTDGDVFENAANTVADVDALVAGAALSPGDRVLDLCCGQGRHTIELARRGFRSVTGIDLSHYLIELARQRAAAAGAAVNFLEGDARHCDLHDRAFDCVTILGNSFGYFEAPEEDAELLRRAHDLLRQGGRLALDLVDGEWLRVNFEKRSWEWLDGGLLICRERSLSRDGERLITREMVLEADRGVVADRFFAERLYSRTAIAALLESVGFWRIRFRDLPQSRSDRDADLGMMGQRLLVTAEAVVDLPHPRSEWPRRIAVVMGDPRLCDSVKPEGQFGESDMQTIARLREALATLTGYRFRYLDDHAELAAALAAGRPDLVLNLCDEGYNNDPTMEAHVPALLDMLGIPYTGARPACLTQCYDKAAVRGIAASLGIPVPDEIFIAADDPLTTIPAGFPALIKPCLGDNSVGIDERSVVDTPTAAREAVARLRQAMPGRPLLMQEFLGGAEYTVGVIGNPDDRFDFLPILEVDYSRLDGSLPRILAYASKWQPDSPYATEIEYKKADLPADVARRLADHATRLFRRLGCRDYARFDFRAAGDGEIKLLEANPNPGWCWDGKLALMAGLAGVDYPDLLRLILEAAERRIAATSNQAAAASSHPAAMIRRTSGH
jgi:D-alanine-D-alanine ligase